MKLPGTAKINNKQTTNQKDDAFCDILEYPCGKTIFVTVLNILPTTVISLDKYVSILLNEKLVLEIEAILVYCGLKKNI